MNYKEKFIMKKFISFVAAVAVMTSSAAGLATDVQAATTNNTRATNNKSTNASRTGKLLTYKQAYNRLKNLSFVTGDAPSTTTNNTNTTVNNNQNKPTGTTNQNKPASTTNDVVTMTDYNGRALSSSMFVYRNTLNSDQRYLYDTIKYAADRGEKSVTFKRWYKRDDINIAFNSVISDNPHMVWLFNYIYGKKQNNAYNSIKLVYDTATLQDMAGSVQLMDDYL